MKSRLFGSNAKLALAILALSSATLTSCYKSEREDVTLPFTPGNAVYTITGEITDITTGKLIDATLTFSGAATLNATAASGAYSVSTETAGTYSVTISSAGYTTENRTGIVIEALNKGQGSTYILNAALYPEAFNIHNIQVDVATAEYGTYRHVLNSNDYGNIYNGSSTSPLFISLKINIDKGTKYEDSTLQDASFIDNDFRQGIADFLKNVYGAEPFAHNAKFSTRSVYYEFNIAPMSSLKQVVSTTYYRKDTYVFRYGDQSITFSVIMPYKADFSYGVEAYTHGGTHVGHGHGDGLNAGGGIIEPIN